MTGRDDGVRTPPPEAIEAMASAGSAGDSVVLASDGSPLLRATVAARDGDTATLRLAGDLDLASAPTLEELINKLERQARVRHVVLDCSELAFTDVAGVRSLVRAHRALDARGGHLTVIGARPILVRVVRLAAFPDHLDIRAPTTG